MPRTVHCFPLQSPVHACTGALKHGPLAMGSRVRFHAFLSQPYKYSTMSRLRLSLPNFLPRPPCLPALCCYCSQTALVVRRRERRLGIQCSTDGRKRPSTQLNSKIIRREWGHVIRGDLVGIRSRICVVHVEGLVRERRAKNPKLGVIIYQSFKRRTVPLIYKAKRPEVSLTLQLEGRRSPCS